MQLDPLSALFQTIKDRQKNPIPDSYTCKLFTGGDNKILKKIGEEATEVVMACKDNRSDLIANEVADLFYHTLVAMAYYEVSLEDVFSVLKSRRK